MPTCAIADDDDVIDTDPLVTEPVIRRWAAGSHPLPPIPPLHEHIEYAAHAIRTRGQRPCGVPRPDPRALVPGSTASLLLTFMRDRYPSPLAVDGPDLQAAFDLAHPGVKPKTYLGALGVLMHRRLVVSTRVAGTTRCSYRLVQP